MFNPYAIRPIGSSRFLEHIKDIGTSEWYSYEYDYEKDKNVEDLVYVCGHLPWTDKTIPEIDPWIKLNFAIILQAILEYLYYYSKRNECLFSDDEATYQVYESRCISLENDYFRKDDLTEQVFDKLLTEVCWMGQDEIRYCESRIKHFLYQ